MVSNIFPCFPIKECQNATLLLSFYKELQRLKEGHCTYFFFHSHSHSHNDIGNVYLLFLSKASGTMTVTMTKKQDKNTILYTF